MSKDRLLYEALSLLMYLHNAYDLSEEDDDTIMAWVEKVSHGG